MGDDIPRLYRFCNFQLRFVKKGSFLRRLQIRTIDDLQGQRMNPGLEWRKVTNPDNCSEAAKNQIIGMLQGLVNVTTTAICHHIEEQHRDGIMEVKACSDFFDHMLFEVFDKPIQEWVPTCRAHEDCDVSCTFGQIPIPSQADDLRYIYLKLSFDVNDDNFYWLAHQLQRDIDARQDEEAAEEY